MARPSSGTTKKERSRLAKRARSGKNVDKGKFDEVANKAAKKYGSKKAGKRVAAAAMWKKAAKKGVNSKGKIKR